jgi:hypothetical protein
MESAVEQPNYTERLAEYYRRLGMPAFVLDKRLWVEQNRMVYPVGPASQSHAISGDAAKQLLAHFPTAVLVRCTGGFESQASSDKWYCTICRELRPIEEYSSNTRKQLRKALRQCVVKKVDAAYVARNGYDVHLAAHQRYGRPPQDKEGFVSDLLIAQDFGDVIDFWAVLYQDVTVGYLCTEIYGDVEAAHCGMAFHPDYFRYYISHALIYTANEYYLQQRSFSHVSNGYRTVWHPSDIYDFLVDRFGYERAYIDLYVYYKPWLAAVMSLPRPVRSMLGRLNSKFAALNTLHDARVQK